MLTTYKKLHDSRALIKIFYPNQLVHWCLISLQCQCLFAAICRLRNTQTMRLLSGIEITDHVYSKLPDHELLADH